MRRIGAGWLIALGFAGIGVGALFMIPPVMGLAFVGVVVLGASIPWAVVGIYTAIQLHTPAALQGRVYSAAGTVLSVPQTMSIAFGAVLVSVVNYRYLLLAVAVVVLLSALYLISKPEQRVRVDPAALEDAALPAEAA